MSDVLTLQPRRWLGALRGQRGGIGGLLLRGAGGSFMVQAGGAAVAFGTQIALARLAGVTDYGMYIYALGWANLLVLLVRLGFDNTLVRFLAQYRVSQSWALYRGLLRRSSQLVLAASLLVSAPAAVLIGAFRDSLGAEQTLTLWMSLGLLPLLGLTALRQGALRSLRRVVMAAFPDTLLRPMLLGCAAAALLLLGAHWDAPQIMLLNLGAAGCAFMVGAWWLLRKLPEPVRTVSPEFRTREWLQVSVPMLWIAGVHFALRQTDILMLGAMLGPSETGVYGAASRIATLVTFGLTAVNALAAPIIAEYHASDRRRDLQRLLTLAARGVFAFTATASLGLGLLGVWLLGWFGSEFQAGYPSLLALLAGQTTSALAGSVGYLLIMSGHERRAARIVGVSAAFNAAANWFLIQWMGILGAAVATAATTVLWNGWMLVYVVKAMRLNPTVLSRYE